jgi:hypothetical protein
MSCCCHATPHTPARRRFSLPGLLVQLAFLYALLVFGGGTLIRTGHPVAQEVGRLMHLVTFVEPTITWADGHGYGAVSGGLRMLASGLPLDRNLV